MAPALTAPTAVRVHRALRLDGMLVLILDNDASIRDGMAALLSGWQCETLLAGSLAEAIRVCGAAERLPDIALIDFHPELGGHRDQPALQVSKDTAAALMADAGFKPVEEVNLFTDKYFIIYGRR